MTGNDGREIGEWQGTRLQLDIEIVSWPKKTLIWKITLEILRNAAAKTEDE